MRPNEANDVDAKKWLVIPIGKSAAARPGRSQ